MSYLMLFVISALVGYLGFHGGAGHTHYRYGRAQGLSPSLWWSLGRGPWASIRVPGTSFRLGHEL